MMFGRKGRTLQQMTAHMGMLILKHSDTNSSYYGIKVLISINYNNS